MHQHRAGWPQLHEFHERRPLDQCLALKGDYYLIQFGHNNEPGKPGRSTDMPTFISDMTRYVDDARALGAKPVLVTPLTRRQWDKSGSGKIKSSLTAYADAVKRIAADNMFQLVDLHTRSIELCERMGREGCYFFSPRKGTNEIDNTHLNAKAACSLPVWLSRNWSALCPN